MDHLHEGHAPPLFDLFFGSLAALAALAIIGLLTLAA
jgi:hypothetical protein